MIGIFSNNPLSAILFSFCLTVFAYVLTGLIKFYRPINDVIIEWLTRKDPILDLQKQYDLLSRAVFGKSIVSLRRNIGISLIFFLIFASLWIASSLPPVQENGSMPALVAQMYALNYFHMWNVAPVECLMLLSIAFILSHLCFSSFNFVTLKSFDLSNSLFIYILAVFIGYILIFFIVSLFSAFTVSVVMAPTNLSIGKVLMTALQETMNFLLGLPDLVSTLNNPSDDKDDWTGVIAIGLLVAFFGTALTSFSSIFILTTMNLVYGLGLGTLKTDLFLRRRIGLDEGAILKDPIRYILSTAAIIIFIVVLAGLALASGFWAVVNRQ